VASATSARADYAAQVNSICASASSQVEPLVGSRSLKATRRGLAILRRELRSLEGIAPAPGDDALVSSWIATRGSIQRLVERDVRLAGHLQRVERRYFNGSPRSTSRLKSLFRRAGHLGRAINRIEGKVDTAADKEADLAFTLGAIDCIGAIGPEELIQG
jgi:hypothetical protein